MSKDGHSLLDNSFSLMTHCRKFAVINFINFYVRLSPTQITNNTPNAPTPSWSICSLLLLGDTCTEKCEFLNCHISLLDIEMNKRTILLQPCETESLVYIKIFH